MAESLQWLGKTYVVIFRHLEAVTLFWKLYSGSLWIDFYIRKKTIHLQIRRNDPPFLPFKSTLW